MTGAAAQPARWKTIVIDAFGFVAVIWSIPIVIVLIGAPIALAVALIRMAMRSIFG